MTIRLRKRFSVNDLTTVHVIYPEVEWRAAILLMPTTKSDSCGTEAGAPASLEQSNFPPRNQNRHDAVEGGHGKVPRALRVWVMGYANRHLPNRDHRRNGVSRTTPTPTR
ncbi:MAG: hypothetical protein KGI99_20195, partial [Bradyrhizobium sp.]|uniref:hypothetical protein n=1 Tax=Bradyrhizobium sp. TaxID=376 RepID=UPI002382ACB9